MYNSKNSFKILKIFSCLLLASTLVNASEDKLKSGSCVMTQDGALSVNFKSYKTPKKLGVGGIFDDVVYTAAAPKGNSLSEILVGSTVTIETKNVNSNNKGRDETLVKYFFQEMSGETITAKVVDIESKAKKQKTGYIITEITMNNVTKKVPMSYTLESGKLEAKGVIDILDFSASKALSSINKACYDLHQGKTWSDVSIGFSTNIKYLSCDQ